MALALKAVALTACALALTSAQALSAHQARQQLIELENRIGTANLHCDYKFFAAIEAPEFYFTGADGSITTRAQDLAGESTCKPSTSSYDVDQTNVWLNGNTAVITGRITITKALQPAQANSGPIPNRIRRSRFTDVFVYRNHQWLLVVGHASNIREIQSAAPAT